MSDVVATKQKYPWQAATQPEANREAILASILQATERKYSFDQIIHPRKTTPFLKLSQRVVEHFVAGARRFVVQGDLDADGITSAVVWERYLKRFAPTHVTLPSRQQGHETLEPLLELNREHQPSHLVILDSGTNLWEKLAQAMGPDQKALIVDHHPARYGCSTDERIHIINPQLLPNTHEERELSTAGLSFYLLPEQDEKALLLSGLGQIGDVMPLGPLSHRIAKETLLRAKNPHPSLANLIRENESLVDLAFSTIPKINSVSRMSHPKLAYYALADDSANPALFTVIDKLNEERKQVTTEFVKKLRDQLDASQSIAILVHEDLPPSIAGIVAAHFASELFRPVLCLGGKEETLSGSFRSPLDLDLGKVIQTLRENGVIITGGGHKRAAGLTMLKAKLDQLKEHLLKLEFPRQRTFLPAPLVPFARLATIQAELDPFGAGTPYPVWAFPFVSRSLHTLRVRSTQAVWANKGELITPQGPIPYLDKTLQEMRRGVALGSIQWNAFCQAYELQVEDFL